MQKGPGGEQVSGPRNDDGKTIAGVVVGGVVGGAGGAATAAAAVVAAPVLLVGGAGGWWWNWMAGLQIVLAILGINMPYFCM